MLRFYSVLLIAIAMCCVGCSNTAGTSDTASRSNTATTSNTASTAEQRATVFLIVQSAAQRQLGEQLVEKINKSVPPGAVKTTFIDVGHDGLIERRSDEAENQILAQCCRKVNSKQFFVDLTPDFVVCDKSGIVKLNHGTVEKVIALCAELARPEPPQQVAEKPQTAAPAPPRILPRKVTKKLLVDPMKKLSTFKAPYNDGIGKLAVSPDSKQIAQLFRNGHLQLVDLRGRVVTDCGYPGVKDKRVQLLPCAQILFAPDGSKIAYRVRSAIVVCDAKNGKLLNLWELKEESDFFWISSDAILVNPLKQLNISSGKEPTIPPFAEVCAGPVDAVSPDGALIACICGYRGGHYRQVQIVDIASCKEVHRIDVEGNPLEREFLGFDNSNRAVFSKWSAGSQEIYTIDVLHGAQRNTVATFPTETLRRNGRQCFVSPTLAVMRIQDSSAVTDMRLYYGKDGKPVWSYTLPYRPIGGDFMGTVPSYFYMGDFCWFPDGSHFVLAGSQSETHDFWTGDSPFALTE